MLEINTIDNSILLTKGDTGVINISLNGDITGYDHLHFYVRNANSQDNVKIHISDDTANLTEEEIAQGRIEGSGANWTVYIASAATQDLKRQKYVYDFKLTGDANVTTFVGGGKEKTEFWVT